MTAAPEGAAHKENRSSGDKKPSDPSPHVDVSRLSDFEVSMLIIERDVAQFRAQRIDELLNEYGVAKGYQETEKKPLDVEHREVYDKLNWEDRTGDKGPFQMLRKDNCNDTQLFNHLDAILKQNKNNITIGDWHFWAGDEGYVFRRRKKQSK